MILPHFIAKLAKDFHRGRKELNCELQLFHRKAGLPYARKRGCLAKSITQFLLELKGLSIQRKRLLILFQSAIGRPERVEVHRHAFLVSYLLFEPERFSRKGESFGIVI